MVKFKNKLETFRLQFQNLIAQNDTDSYPPFFFGYNRGLVDEKNFYKQVLNIKYLFEIAKRPIKGAKVLDVGCGFGLNCVILAILGASEVHGMDYNELWIKAFNAYLDAFKLDLPIMPKIGDASHLPYSDNSFDVLLSIEAISHYKDADRFLVEANRVLKDNGILIISDANNGSNFFIRTKNYRIWDRFENGPPSSFFYGHEIKKSFLNMRKEIIMSRFPQLDMETITTLAENTFGMGEEEIVAVCSRYLKEGIMPDSKYRKKVTPINPITNDCIERLLEPKLLVKKFKNNGLSARVFSHFGGAGRKNIIGIANSFLRFLTPISIYFAPSFKIVAVKRNVEKKKNI